MTDQQNKNSGAGIIGIIGLGNAGSAIASALPHLARFTDMIKMPAGAMMQPTRALSHMTILAGLHHGPM